MLPPQSINCVQKIIRTLLCYDIAIDSAMLIALGSVAFQQAKFATATYDEVILLLNYFASRLDAIIPCIASNMILHVHSNASYLSDPHAHSHV